jgi:hypothetical protein
MKRSKWLKWKIGAVSALGIAFLFHEVKNSQAFAQAYANAASPGGGNSNQSPAPADDPLMDDWYSGQADSSGNGGFISDRRGHRERGFRQDGGGIGGGMTPDDSGSIPGSGSGIGPSPDSSSGSSRPPGFQSQTRTRRS